MSMSRLNRLITTQTAVTSPRYARSEEGGITRKECQPKIIKRRKNVSKSKRKAYRSQPQQFNQEQQTVEHFTPIKTARRPLKPTVQFPVGETDEDKVHSDGELSIDEEELDKLAEQVYKFRDRINQLHNMKDDVKWLIYRNVYLVMVMFIVYMIIGGHHILPASMKEFSANFLTKQFGTEYYYGSMIFNVFQDMGTVISSNLVEGLDFGTHYKKWFP